MANRTSNDASRSLSIGTTRFQSEDSTDAKKQISGNKRLYIAKNCVAFKFEKIKKSFSTLIHGKEHSKQAHSNKIIHIKSKINDAKNSLNTSEKKQASTTSFHEKSTENRSQIREKNQERQPSPNNRNNPSSNQGPLPGMVIPPFLTAA